MIKDIGKIIWHAVLLIVIFLWVLAGVKDMLGIKTEQEHRHQKAIERMAAEDPFFYDDEYKLGVSTREHP